MAWQAFVIYNDALMGWPIPPRVGKVRSSRKEARLEAKRLAQRVLDTWVHPSWGITVPDVPSVNRIVSIPAVEGMYGHNEGRSILDMGVRWQPDPIPGWDVIDTSTEEE